MFNWFFKKKRVKTTFSDLRPILVEIMNSLYESENIGQANYIKKTIEVLDQQKYDELIKNMKSIEMWGGAGSVADVYYNFSEGKGIRFWNAMIELIKLLKEMNIGDKRIYETEGVYKKFIKYEKIKQKTQ